MVAARELWGARAAILVIGLVLAGLVVRFGLVIAWSDIDPARAAAIDPGNGRAAMAAARYALEHKAGPEAPKLRLWADRALRRDTTLTGAIELKALQAQADGDPARAAWLFRLSAAISRRSLATRLWLIQQAVDRGDAAGALEGFDLALRTSNAAPPILFPVLERAAADPQLAAGIAAILDRPEDWRLLFLYHGIKQPGAAASLAKIVIRMRDRPFLTANHVDAMLIQTLVGEGRFADARQVDLAFHSTGGNGSIRDGDFSNPAAAFPFGWSLVAKGDAQANRDRIGLVYSGSTGATTQLAAQLLTLGPGRYRLTATTGSDLAGNAPNWTLTCADRAAAPALAVLFQPARAKASADIAFAVPEQCAGQWLTLRLTGQDAASGAIASISVVPA